MGRDRNLNNITSSFFALCKIRGTSTTRNAITLLAKPIKKASPKRVWVLDFDQTLSIGHTYYSQEDGRLISETQRSNNLRNPNFMREFIQQRNDAGDLVIIVTAHPNPLHVAAYVSSLFKDKDLENLADNQMNTINKFGNSSYYSYYRNDAKPIKCIWSVRYNHPTRPGKNAAIECALETLGYNVEEIGKQNITLIDDDENNCIAALNDGYKAVWASVENDDYLEEIKNKCSLSQSSILRELRQI